MTLAVPLGPAFGGAEVVGLAVLARHVQAPARLVGSGRVEAGLDAVDDIREVGLTPAHTSGVDREPDRA